jgi:transposase-like protein
MPTKPLDRKLAAEAVAAVDAADGNVVAAALALGIIASTLRGRLRTAAVKYSLTPKPRPPAERKPSPPPPQPLSESERREIARLKADLARVREEQSRTDGEALLAEAIREARGKVSAMPIDPPRWTAQPERMGDAAGLPVLMLTDWHIGETVVPAEVAHRNVFSAEIAEERAERVIKRAIALAAKHVDKARGGVVFLGGDFVSGWLHEELIRGDYCSPLQAVAWCVSRLTHALRTLRDAWGRLFVVGVSGNHGRLTRRPPGAGHSHQAFDWLIYVLVAEALRERPEDRRTIEISVPDAGEQIVPVAGTRYHLMHGHQLGVKGGDGIIGALGPITRGAVKVGGANRSLGQDADILVIGHYHTTLWLPRAIVGGTLRGYSAWDRTQRYGWEPASQLLWFSHPRWGANSPIRVFLQDEISATEAA